MLELAENMNNARYLNKNYMLQTAELIDKINKFINTFPFLNKDFKLVKPLTITVKDYIIENYPLKRNLCLR